MTDGTNEGMTLTKIGQIFNFYDYGQDPAYTNGITLGNGTFLVFYNWELLGTKGMQLSLYQGNQVRYAESSPSYTISPDTTSNWYLAPYNTGFGTPVTRGYIIKVSNDETGGLIGGGNYAKFIQPF